MRNVAEPRSLSIVRYENDPSPLPPGQRAIADFPRFGVVAFAKRPLRSMEIRLEISGSVGHPITLRAAELATLPRTSVAADFHCAAGWSHRSVEWSGLRFRDVWDTFIAPHAQLRIEHGLAVLRCQDRYRTALPLADLLRPEVLVADQLNGQPLTVEHGAPIRLVAPAHYGYKSAKHLVGIELRPDDQGYRPLLPRLLDHPRARVALEERGQLLPGWLLRYLFRPLIRPLIRRMQRATEQQRTRP
ncbi:MAG TPA: molybdopterin-dependent oxidoreductase [Povalibacter sp.]|nr:molybdopterin-dependent oxidoreductase [Povalibacter sp.]